MKAGITESPGGSISLNLKTNKAEDFLRVGNEAIDRHKGIREALKVFEEIRKSKEEIEREKNGSKKLSLSRRFQLKKLYLKLLAREVKAEFKLTQAMENLRGEMLVPRISQDSLNKLVGRVNIDGIGGAEASRVQSTLMEFARMFNGRGLGDQPITGSDVGERLMKITKVPPSRGDARSYAQPYTGRVFLTNGASKGEMFHEFGHILESQTPSFVKFSEQWRNSKALSADEIRRLHPGIPIVNVTASPGVSMPAVRLMNLHPESYDDPREVTLVGRFMDGYLGKVYPGGGTEVFSVAIESFADSTGMATLAKSHPDLFAHFVGMAMAD